MPIYKRPPVIEAVIDIRVEGALDQGQLQRLNKDFSASYPFSEESQHIGVELSENAAKINQSFAGYTMRNAESTDALVLTPASIATTRQAPYDGWERLRAAAEGNWLQWRKAVGRKKIVRIGVRFINRLDIPIPENQLFNLDDYLDVGIRLPAIGLAIHNYAVHLQANAQEQPFKLVLNVGSTPSPLIGAASALLDLDVFQEGDLPQTEEDLWPYVETFRAQKNHVFESCITDKARELFNR
ncbi:TIGR04255 family protein [Nitrobacter sp.]|uniref:TIGR04255 family protein n=1 Tax=Nitrobacter sp. TaxID=29420 RepID=UPI0029CAB62B|nr:TIGR04255 family protein [Nitrobacter sp.]